MSDVTPFAGCPVDRTPLIATFEVPKKEWHCMTCGGYFGWLAARGVPATPEVEANYEDLLARFKAGERGGQQAEDVAGPDDEDLIARPALGRTHPAGNRAL